MGRESFLAPLFLSFQPGNRDLRPYPLTALCRAVVDPHREWDRIHMDRICIYTYIYIYTYRNIKEWQLIEAPPLHVPAWVALEDVIAGAQVLHPIGPVQPVEATAARVVHQVGRVRLACGVTKSNSHHHTGNRGGRGK